MSLSTIKAHSVDSDQTGMPRLIRVFAEPIRHFVGFFRAPAHRISDKRSKKRHISCRCTLGKNELNVLQRLNYFT